MKYPIITAYEFEFLKEELEVKERIKNSTVYIIAQRPLLYMDNFIAEDGVITFEIQDSNGTPPLKCTLLPSEIGLGDNDFLIHCMFYKDTPDTQFPYNFMAGFKILDKNEKFLVWYSPQKFIYEACINGLDAKIEGDLNNYLDYKVHYIGKAFDQRVWDRLTGHEKFQKVLTLEKATDNKAYLNSLEVSLMLVEIHMFHSGIFDTKKAVKERGSVSPKKFSRNTQTGEKFFSSDNAIGKQHTNELEAYLVNKFEPEYNETKFKTYPKIKTGMRTLGYSHTLFHFSGFPAILETNKHKAGPVLFSVAEL